MSRALSMWIALPLALATACGGEPSNSGADEPLRVPSAFFREGAFPGIPVDDLPEDPEELEAITPRIPAITPGTGTVRPGQAAVSLRGTTTEDAYSIAIRLAESPLWVNATTYLAPTRSATSPAALAITPPRVCGSHSISAIRR